MAPPTCMRVRATPVGSHPGKVSRGKRAKVISSGVHPDSSLTRADAGAACSSCCTTAAWPAAAASSRGVHLWLLTAAAVPGAVASSARITDASFQRFIAACGCVICPLGVRLEAVSGAASSSGSSVAAVTKASMERWSGSMPCASAASTVAGEAASVCRTAAKSHHWIAWNSASAIEGC